MSQSNYITLALFAVIGLVFLIDFIKNNSKKSIDKNLKEFVEKEDKKTNNSNPIYWILNRKKNIALSLVLILILKIITHFYFFRECWYLSKGTGLRGGTPRNLEGHYINYSDLNIEKYKDYNKFNCDSIGDVMSNIFTDKLELFVPVTIVFLVVVWFFNDKIKAQ